MQLMNIAKFARVVPMNREGTRVMYVAYETEYDAELEKLACEALAEELGKDANDPAVLQYLRDNITDEPERNVIRTVDAAGYEIINTDAGMVSNHWGWVEWVETD